MFEKEIAKEAENARKFLGYLPDIANPRTFNEHILHNKFFCRDELLVTTTDKVAVNDFVIQNGLGDILIKNYHVTDDPETIPFDTLPGRYIVKPNQLSGQVIAVWNRNISRETIKSKCRSWLKQTHYGKQNHIWCTSMIKPQIIVQELIHENPIDFKFQMIHGRCAFITVYSADRIGGHPRRQVSYDLEWNRLPFKLLYEFMGEVERPEKLDDMIKISEKLSKPFNYVRVDLYNVHGKIYFGELTHFPYSGYGGFDPVEWDYKYGELFKKWGVTHQEPPLL